MTAEAGLFFLILAFACACAQALLPLAARKEEALHAALSAPLAWVQCLLVTLSFITLISLRLSQDFSVQNVAEHSSRSMPWLYQITGTWGNHEGSMVLWVWVLALFGALLSTSRARDTHLIHTALPVQGALSAGFLLFILLTSNPFARIFPPPPDGNELNPLLQDIGLALHPPLLYIGYVGFSIVFALAVAALLTRNAGKQWAETAHPWILAAWSFLTLGIGLGSWWAYRELGWGGWWFWDPVENASLLPWLAGTALLHSNIVLQKRGQLAHWVLLLAILTFGLSLLGTFLVRSGVLTSVHSFASDPARGYFILAYMLCVTGGGLLLYALRAPAIAGGEALAPLSREGSIVINNLFLVTACLTVLLGTLYPLFAEWLQNARITVGPPYFNATFLPLMVVPLILAALAPLLPWKKAKPASLPRTLAPALAAALAAALLVAAFAEREKLLGAAGMALAAWLGVASLMIIFRRIRLLQIPLRESWQLFKRLPAAVHAVALSHLGVAILVAGVTASSLWHYEQERMIRPGDRLTLGQYQLHYTAEKQATRSNHIAKIGAFQLEKEARTLAILAPEYRAYTQEGARTSEVALYSRPWYDIYAVIGESSPEGDTAARAYLKPMMQFIWAGCVLMALGGMVPLLYQRKRLKA